MHVAPAADDVRGAELGPKIGKRAEDGETGNVQQWGVLFRASYCPVWVDAVEKGLVIFGGL